MTHKNGTLLTRAGKISYQTAKPGYENGLWGGEDFILTRFADGSRTLRAHCRLNDDPPLVRDVMLSVDAGFHPQDATARLVENGAFKGAAFYHFTDTQVSATGYDARGRQFCETHALTRDIRGFGMHALVSDGWLMARMNYVQGPGVQHFAGNFLTSDDHRGATGPAIARTNSSVEYVGEETITVPAGTFDCHHHRFVTTSTDHPPYNLWVTADGDFMFVKGSVPSEFEWGFELESLEDTVL